MSCTTLAVSLGKGGTMKSSIAANLAGLAALAEWRTLVVDMDRQGHQTMDLGVDDQTDNGESLANAITGATSAAFIIQARPGLDVLPGGHHLGRLGPWLLGMLGSGQTTKAMECFRDLIDTVGDPYDLVVVDCPPGDTLVVRTVYVAADAVLIPSMIDAGSRSGLDEVGDHIVEAQRLGSDVDVLGVVLTGVHRQASAMERAARLEFEADLAGSDIPVLGSIVHDSRSTATECRRRGLLVHELEAERAGLSTGSTTRAGLAQDYEDLAAEVLGRLAKFR